MVDALDCKEMILGMGANICGIASVDRFHGAPQGFRPTDIDAETKSVIVFAKRVPSGSLDSSNCISYTHVNNVLTHEIDTLGVSIAYNFEDLGVRAIPIPSDDPYEHWESKNSYGRAILSLRHAGVLAGLGVLGRNTLLINREHGNMIQIGAVLVNIELKPDPLADYQPCPPNCTICIDACPEGALDGTTVNQELCRPLSNYQHEKGYILKKCNTCRRVCPNRLGIET